VRTRLCAGCGEEIGFIVFADVGSPAGYWIICGATPSLGGAMCGVWGFHAPMVTTRPVVVADLARVFWSL
jgi:hypothetical protein